MGIRIALLSLGLAFTCLAGGMLAQDPRAAATSGVASPSSGRAANPAATAKNAEGATTSGAQPAAATEKKKPKKVWTNDEIGSVGGTISVVGDADKTESAPAAKKDPNISASNDLKTKQIEVYRDQIRQLKAQMDEADKRIAQLKNFKGENNSAAGGINPNQGYNMVPIEDQVKQLEANKKQMQNKIEDVENEARKNGIESGDLR